VSAQTDHIGMPEGMFFLWVTRGEGMFDKDSRMMKFEGVRARQAAAGRLAALAWDRM
jgi:hypothetical protein